jgi:integrase
LPKISKRAVDAATPQDRDYFLWDDELPCFGLRVFTSGRKSYVVQYKVGGRGGATRRLSLGPHGALTPDQARALARQTLGERAGGGDPIAERIADRKAETVEQLCHRYFAAAEKGLVLGKKNRPKKASTLATDQGRIERHIIPLLGRKRVKEVTPADVVGFMRDVIAGKTATDVRTGKRGRAIVEGGPGTATRTVGLLGGIFSYAVSEGLRPDNPVRGIKRPADRRRERRLSLEEYRALGEALEEAARAGENPAAVAALWLLALTGARLGEIAHLKHAEVDRRAQCLRLADSKEGGSVRPLAAAALAVLDALPKREGFDYVLPGETGDRPFGGLPKAIQRIVSRSAALAGVTAHVLRHSFASVADELGYTEATVAALLGQRSGTVTRRYIHHLDRALIAAADQVAAHVDAAMRGNAGAEVIEMSKSGIQSRW